MINSTMQSGLHGMQTAYQGMTQSAADIARLNTRNNDAGANINAELSGVTEPLVALRMNQNLFDASAKVLSTSDAMIGSLLDVTV
ncbi:MAG: hypothetical protein WD071_13745 [Pseudohongiella sp.]|uniref:hypothetical protein n=1 Tax=Pseudohongiella sp. TaxID=1979412 RepID=UPI0034A030FF